MYKPDVVILDGGRRDTFVPEADRFQITASTIGQAHEIWPNAKIVYIQPRYLAKPGDDLGAGDGIADRLKEASKVEDLVVVDPILSFKDTDTKPLIAADGTNPSAAGERALADALVKALTTSGMQPAT
jgi:lysophospholipase L1-like esterase